MDSSSPPCHFCGRPDAHLFADQFICDDCYVAKGSCCAGDEDPENESEPK